jgi:phosphoglycolate phosphatase-like HAD superfamily hydrolase
LTSRGAAGSKVGAIKKTSAARAPTLSKKPEFKAVFFDLDGTLVDIHGPLYLAAKKALDDLGHTPQLTRERYWQAVAQDDRMLGVPEQMQRDFAKLAFAYFMTEVDSTERMEILPQVPEVLAELKRRGFATAVVTSRPGDSRLLLKKLAMVGLAAHLDQVVTQNTTSITRALDKSDSLRETALRAAIDPGACVYVGDEPRDIMAATNAHFGAAIAVSTGPATFDHLLTHPEHKPHHVMRSMGELLGVLENFSHYTK